MNDDAQDCCLSSSFRSHTVDSSRVNDEDCEPLHNLHQDFLSEKELDQYSDRNRQKQHEATAFGRAVIDAVIRGSSGIGEPTKAAWCFQSKAITQVTPDRCAGGNSFVEGWNTKSDLWHFYFLIVMFAGPHQPVRFILAQIMAITRPYRYTAEDFVRFDELFLDTYFLNFYSQLRLH